MGAWEPIPGTGGGGGGGGNTILYSGDVVNDPVALATLSTGSVVRITWSGDRGIFGPHGVTNGGTQTLWILTDGSADYGGAAPAFCRWSCAGGVISLWLDAVNVTCRCVVEKIK